MSANLSVRNDLEAPPPAVSFQTLGLMLGAAMVGALAAVYVLPAWLPGLASSLAGAAPHAYWYLSRSSAFVAYILLWLSMALGLLITNRLARVWPGGPAAFDVHQYVSLLGLAFAVFHVFILLGDQNLRLSLGQLLAPFAAETYRPFWVGLGQVGLYALGVVALSYYVRKPLGRNTWRLLHYLSFGTYLLALTHGLASGTDSATLWARGLYWVTGSVLLLLFFYRILAKWVKPVAA
jgi:predicted ferric reductase